MCRLQTPFYLGTHTRRRTGTHTAASVIRIPPTRLRTEPYRLCPRPRALGSSPTCTAAPYGILPLEPYSVNSPCKSVLYHRGRLHRCLRRSHYLVSAVSVPSLHRPSFLAFEVEIGPRARGIGRRSLRLGRGSDSGEERGQMTSRRQRTMSMAQSSDVFNPPACSPQLPATSLQAGVDSHACHKRFGTCSGGFLVVRLHPARVHFHLPATLRPPRSRDALAFLPSGTGDALWEVQCRGVNEARVGRREGEVTSICAVLASCGLSLTQLAALHWWSIMNGGGWDAGARDMGAGALRSQDAAVLALVIVNAFHFAISARYLFTTIAGIIVVYLPAYISDSLHTNPLILHMHIPFAYSVLTAIRYFSF